MSREIEDRLEEVVDELSWLANQDEITDKQSGYLASAETSVVKVLEQKRNARHLNAAWDGGLG